jgi:hypothetical protein
MHIAAPVNERSLSIHTWTNPRLLCSNDFLHGRFRAVFERYLHAREPAIIWHSEINIVTDLKHFLARSELESLIQSVAIQ